MNKYNHRQLILLAATAPCHLKTAASYADPEKRARMKPVVLNRVRAAAQLIGLPENQAPESAP